MAESGSLQWTIILVLTALLLSFVVLAQLASVYTAAYLAAPHEIVTFIDTADFSIQENESYDRDVAKVQRLEDKIRLAQLLREIQKSGDDLREDLNGMLIEEGTTKLRTSARMLWATKRSQLEDRVRRLDLLRMRFLVVYMGVIASNAERPPAPAPKEPEKSISPFESPSRPMLPKGLVESIAKRPPLRRLTTQAIGHNEHVATQHAATPQRMGWAGVIHELQRSPKMHQRHSSIEQSMSRATKTP
ncbi:Fc.00g098140.m01.CDS01 [Cosmosporella sp. VM-42]